MIRRNLVLLTVECWRGDHFGDLTPNLSRLGSESAVFSSAFAAGGWTLPSMTALMSSAYASMFGGPGVSLASPERQVLAECLMRAGYWTAGCTSNIVCGTIRGFHRGFGRFRDEERRLTPEQLAHHESRRGWKKMVELGVPPRSQDNFADAIQVTDRGLQWVEAYGPDRPYFLWLHYMEPHWPCLTPEGELSQSDLFDAWRDRAVFAHEVVPRRGRFDPGEEMAVRWIQRYRQALTVADREIGRLLQTLRSRPDWDRTVVVATGDHGEAFQEHGTWHHAWNQMHREGLHVPLIIRVPGALPTTIAQQVSNLDLAPTLIDFAGATEQQGIRPMMGRSLRPAIEGKPLAERPVYSEMLAHRDSFSYVLSILDGDWKYIYDLDQPHDSKLFRVSDDPGETRNLRDTNPDLFRRFERLRFEHVSLGLTAIMQRRDQPTAFEIDPLVKEQMVALGYMSAD